MEKIEAKKLFQPFIDKIKDEVIKDFTDYCFDELPDYWFVKPASSTGKYHPAFAQGDGGLVRHTLAMLKIYDVLWRGFEKEFKSEAYELGIFACIFHDALKYGKEETFPNGLQWTTKGHELDAAEWVGHLFDKYVYDNLDDEEYASGYFDKYQEAIAIITSAIEHHMGPWSKTGAPETLFDRLIFIADYMASSKWFEEEVFNVRL